MTEDLKQIKKLYGEKMMHFCRDFFSSILEEKGLLPQMLQNNFAPSHELYEDLVAHKMTEEFKNYIYDLFHEKDEKIEIIDVPTPQELMRQAGYILYECKTEEEIQAFKKYYAWGEELCTFHGGRLEKCHVFFAIKENVSDIRRENYKNPERQDEYGTSVISIQFSRDMSHTLSIKNRYNHTVNNPDATFGNNLDNIILGLTESFEKFYGLKQEFKNDYFEIPGYVRANDGKWYKYNIEMDNIYYCPDNIIIDHGEVNRYPKEKYIIMDYFILNLTQKTIELYERFMHEALPNVIGEIKKIIIEKKGEEKEITIINTKDEEIIITIDKNNQIIGFKSNDIKLIGNNFLAVNRALKSLDIPNLQRVGSSFLFDNNALTHLNLPNLQKAGSSFLRYNYSLTSLNLPELKEVGNSFLIANKAIENVNLPKLEQVGDSFLANNEALVRLALPLLQSVGIDFLYYNKILADVYLPSLQKVEIRFLYCNNALVNLELPKLQSALDCFMPCNFSLVSFKAPLLQEVGESFLYENRDLKTLELPSLKFAESKFLYWNEALTYLELPKLVEVRDYFLCNNKSLAILKVPSLRSVRSDFLCWNKDLSVMECPLLKIIGQDFLYDNSLMREKVIRQIQENNMMKR